jgi:putative transcriptional regulator
LPGIAALAVSSSQPLAVYGSKNYNVHMEANPPGKRRVSEALAALHESMSDLHQAGAIDNKTMREFDRACITPVMELSPAAIRRIRSKAAVSQAVFAAHLNVTTGVVSKWERGEKQPRGPAAKLLTLAAKNGIAAIA